MRSTLVRRILLFFRCPVLILAGLWRRLLPTTFVAVGGSVGKTTAKEMMAAVLARKGATYRSFANQNAGVTILLNVLRVRPRHRFAVIESSADFGGRTSERSWLLRPDIAVMLAVRRTHTDVFPTLEDTAAEKVKIFDHLAPGGVGVLNGEDERVATMAERAPGRIRRFGRSPEFEVWAEDVRSV